MIHESLAASVWPCRELWKWTETDLLDDIELELTLVERFHLYQSVPHVVPPGLNAGQTVALRPTQPATCEFHIVPLSAISAFLHVAPNGNRPSSAHQGGYTEYLINVYDDAASLTLLMMPQIANSLDFVDHRDPSANTTFGDGLKLILQQHEHANPLEYAFVIGLESLNARVIFNTPIYATIMY
ncbi:hypothetical protein H9P43_008990 [Blastocladiella emersonii ATCC 22665]|nr:hypothetical protein H9P43_008990 [Blastocladiella emersonii ATCC 22665]